MKKHNISPIQPITFRELITEVYQQPCTRKLYRRVSDLLIKLDKQTKFIHRIGTGQENENLKCQIEEMQEQLTFLQEDE